MEKKASTVKTADSIENLNKLLTQIKKDYNKNQKGINSQIAELKTAISSASDSFENFSQNINVTNSGNVKTALESIGENINNDINRLYSITDTVNIDVNRLSDLVDEFKTNVNTSNQTVADNMIKIENMLSEYNTNLAEINSTPALAGNNIKDAIKSLNDDFYLEILNLFNNLSFEDETEDLKDFMEGVLSAITVKTDENSEKLNNIMLQFKNLLNKMESIEKAQNSISDYLKPEDENDLVYSFDDIQSDLAKMRLVLNDISNSVSSSEMVEEISDKIRQTNEQIEIVSKMLGTTSETDENVTDIRKQIESLNSQVYDISMRTNKLLLTNEDSTLELKNNLEIFKEVFDKANPEKIYELFYELTHYFNDVNDKIIEVAQTTRAAHAEAVTIKNALSYLGGWADSATNILNELQANSFNSQGTIDATSIQIPELNEITAGLNDIKQYQVAFQGLIDIIKEAKSASVNNIQTIGNEFTLLKSFVNHSISSINEKILANEENMNNQLAQINAKLDMLLQPKAPAKKTTRTKKTAEAEKE